MTSSQLITLETTLFPNVTFGGISVNCGAQANPQHVYKDKKVPVSDGGFSAFSPLLSDKQTRAYTCWLKTSIFYNLLILIIYLK